MALAVGDEVFAIFSANSFRFVPKTNENIGIEDNAVHVRLQYIAEGNANVIFSVAVDSENETSSEASFFENKLLRVPKFPSGSTRTLSVQSAQDFKINETVNQELVIIEQILLRHLHEHINHTNNRPMRGGRSGSIWDPSLHPEAFINGILVTDMRPKNSEGQVTLRFKPKWLTQSPNAPSKSRRCRTCALQASQGSNKTTHHCPLALATGKREYVLQQLSAIIDAQVSTLSDALIFYREHFAQYFCDGTGHAMIRRLKSLQEQLDPFGILKCVEQSTMNSHSFRQADISALAKAMTFRDCSIYVRITPLKSLHELTGTNDVRYEVRLGDLDEKLPENIDDVKAVHSKLNKWATAERKLIEEGYYFGTEKLESGQERHKNCFLWNDPIT